MFVLFGGGCATATGYMAEAPGPEFAATAGILLLVCFVDMALGITRETRYILCFAILCGNCGSASMIAVGLYADRRATAAMVASTSFLVANSTVLVALHLSLIHISEPTRPY